MDPQKCNRQNEDQTRTSNTPKARNSIGWVVFGGLGLDGGNGRKNDIPHVLFANNLKLEAKIYNETHLLLPMNGLSTTAYASAGVISDGMTCAPSGPVPVPPKVEPDEPLRP